MACFLINILLSSESQFALFSEYFYRNFEGLESKPTEEITGYFFLPEMTDSDIYWNIHHAPRVGYILRKTTLFSIHFESETQVSNPFP